ncbi:MAG: hypothetical protein ACRDTD_13010 [Pseudonocardiaceae bacterium]
MSFRSDIENVLAITNTGGIGTNQMMHDEHARHQMYLNALSLASSLEERELIATVLRDPDGVMAEAAVVSHIDRQASVLNSRSSYENWANRVVDLMSQHDFLVCRIKEWKLFKGIMEDGVGSVDALRDASDWLQRKVAQDATSRAVLEKLAEVGRTKRVRNIASSRSKHPRL